jgi:hypothetical protein
MSWTKTNAPNKIWITIASSSDGTKLAAVNGGSGSIYTSSNSGVTWTLTSAPNESWQCIASSSDGTKLAAGINNGANNGAIYTSSNSGVTWVQTSAPNGSWYSIASSSDGTKLAAVISGSGGVIYTSSDSGVTWTQTSAPTASWQCISSSSDGTKLAAGIHLGGGIYTSSNSGVTWTLTSAPTANWLSIASSSDGTKLAAGIDNGAIYTSSNSGVTWTLTSAPTNKFWYSIASSSNGTKLAASYNGGIYISSNSGVTWTANNPPSDSYWYSIASSSDGTKLATVALNGGIYTYQESIVCFKEDTKILTNKGYIPIQDLQKGDLIKTKDDGFKEIFMIGYKQINHYASQDRIKEQLYKYTQEKYPEIFEDLIITGCHSILVDNFKDELQRETVIKALGDIYVTDNKYRLPAFLDEKSEVYEIPGTYTIYHIALENENYYYNYGIYANGLLVESCSKRYLKELSDMILIE